MANKLYSKMKKPSIDSDIPDMIAYDKAVESAVPMNYKFKYEVSPSDPFHMTMTTKTPTLEWYDEAPMSPEPDNDYVEDEYVDSEYAERTLVLLKPDAYERALVGEIMSIVDQRKLNLIGAKQIQMDLNTVKKHYKNHVQKPFFPDLVDFMTSGPSLALVYEGPNACAIVRQLIGEKHPTNSPAGSIRGRYASEYPRNLIHGSDYSEDAEYEIALYFTEDELFGKKFKQKKEKQDALAKAKIAELKQKVIAKGVKSGQVIPYPEMVQAGMTLTHIFSDHQYIVDKVDHGEKNILITVYNASITDPKPGDKVELTYNVDSDADFENSWKVYSNAKGA